MFSISQIKVNIKAIKGDKRPFKKLSWYGKPRVDTLFMKINRQRRNRTWVS